MKLLLDESLPHEFRLLPTPIHVVFTAAYLGWGGVTNGKLLALAADHGFDGVVTTDRGYEYQQNLLSLPCSVILLLAKTNKIDDVRHFASPLLIALRSIKASTFLKLQPY